jgi:hypothetical protein
VEARVFVALSAAFDSSQAWSAYRNYPISSSQEKIFNARHEKWQKDLPSMWARFYCSLASAPFGKDILGSASINALSLPEL